MTNMNRLKLELDSLSIYRSVIRPQEKTMTKGLENNVPAILYRLVCACAKGSKIDAGHWGELFSELCRTNHSENLAGAVAERILHDENIFTLAAVHENSSKLPENVLDAVRRDLQILQRFAELTAADFISGGWDEDFINTLPQWKTGVPARVLNGQWKECLPALAQFHKQNGCGIFAKYCAFLWRKGKMEPIAHIDPIRIANLKGYERQRSLVLDNTQAFVQGYPANNTLLYGDRGTGKSSTIHALLNEFSGDGLRMIEMPKEYIREFPQLVAQIAGIPLRFIVYIDDLSFSQGDDTFAGLKAVLEGGLSCKPENTLIYATSNRRHLVRETHTERQGDDVSRGDTMQELLSLSDRFGLSVTFLNPDREKFYMILDGIAADRRLEIDTDLLHQRAEQWALSRGGRSPRVARQYIDLVEGRIRRGLDF